MDDNIIPPSGPAQMVPPTQRPPPYDVKGTALRIAKINDPHHRVQELNKVPMAFRHHVSGMIQMLIRERLGR